MTQTFKATELELRVRFLTSPFPKLPRGGEGTHCDFAVTCAISVLLCLSTRPFYSVTDGNSSDSDMDGTTVLNLQPRARRFLPDQFSKKASPAYKMEWKNEVDVGSARAPPSVTPTPRSKEGGTQTPGVLRQPLLSKDQRFGRGREDSLTEDVPPKPPPRLVRRASEPGNRKGRLGNEKP